MELNEVADGSEVDVDGPCDLILVVEDNPINQKVMTLLLKKLGFQTEIAPDGIAGVELAAKRQYAAILMDCQMPKLDGYAATADIRRTEATLGRKRTPIIAVTANMLASERDSCFACGMDEYLQKPISFATLQDLVFRWVSTFNLSERNSSRELPET